MKSNTTGSRNTASGYGSLTANTTGNENNAFGYDSLYGANELGLNLLSDYFGLKNNDIEKPTKINIGFSTINNQKNSFGLIFNYEINNYTEESSLKDNQRFSLGVEHYTINQIPIRFGLEYRTSEFSALSSATSFSAGSGFKLYGFSFDYGIRYKNAKYSFPDIFPVEGEFRPDLDLSLIHI